MGIFEVHTNIPVDYPTSWTGSIYREANIGKLFSSEVFIEKIVNGELCGTVGFKRLKKIPPNFVSHKVIDAYISESKEIVFKIETIDSKPGKKLEIMLGENPHKYLAKMIAMIDVNKSINGIQHLVDITYVHIDENDCFNNFSPIDGEDITQK